MAHRRKSSHPVCKARRNLGASWDILKEPGSEEEIEEDHEDAPKTPGRGQDKTVTMETETETGQQIFIPPDLFKDFEAVRSQTKMDTTDLMRRLLKDYQSLAASGTKQTNQDDPVENDYHHSNVSLASKASIASDVSLATTRVDTDEDEFQGLDLTVKPSRKIDSRLFDTKSLNEPEVYDQPLDLTCTKPASLNDASSRESPSSSHIELASVNNEFNYVYVYPGLYPPNSGMIGQEECESPKGITSPVPELISPNRVTSPEVSLKNQYLSTNMAIEPSFGLMNPTMAYHSMMSSMTKGPLSPIDPPETPANSSSKSLFDIGKSANNTDRSQVKQNRKTGPGRGGGRAMSERGNKAKEKKSQEMKVISESTAYPGVYTSVMKLPWSRRTRTKKPKHKVKLEDTLVPQFMLEQQERDEVKDDHSCVQIVSQSSNFSSAPQSSSSVMMVYPNATSSSFGKPSRKRGRPPKLPMLAKMLQHEEDNKRAKKSKTNNGIHVEVSHPQVQTSGGMIMYNSGGQLMTAYGTIPLPPPTSMSDQQGQQTHAIPNMSQAQLIGQFPLSQFTGGPIQFLGQFPLPIQGQATLQPMPFALPDAQNQQETVSGADDDADSPNKLVKNAAPVSYQYAFQPMLIPTPVPAQVQLQSTAGVMDDKNEEEVETNTEEISPRTTPSTVNQTEEANKESLSGKATHVMKHEESNTVNTMNTTSIANTGSGAIYQEMILSSKSLVDVKKRKRQTAIQLLKSKSNDQNFLCTSFRIRPRLVAQAQAQRERLAAKCPKDDDSVEIVTDQKNLNGPQNDSTNHFGEKIINSVIDISDLQIKREIDEDEMDRNLARYGIDHNILDPQTDLQEDNCDKSTYVKVKTETTEEREEKVLRKPNSAKRFMLTGSQKRKARCIRNGAQNCQRRIDEDTQAVAISDDLEEVKENQLVIAEPGEMFQELFNCKICNTIIPVDQMESHSTEHIHLKSEYKCENCGSQFEAVVENENGELPKCTICQNVLTKADPQLFTRYGHGKIACDECPEVFKSLPEFYEHKTDVHKNENSMQGEFGCDFCGKTFQFYHALQFHCRTHRERKVPCEEKTCHLRFRSRKEMEIHFDANHLDKKEYFHCVYAGCTKKFLKNFHLQEHIRVKHYNIKAFQCPWPGCIKEFAARRHLKIHLLIHRDEKPMKCDHCDYRCRQRSAMNWHMRKHPDVPYKYKRSVKSPSASTTESE